MGLPSATNFHVWKQASKVNAAIVLLLVLVSTAHGNADHGEHATYNAWINDRGVEFMDTHVNKLLEPTPVMGETASAPDAAAGPAEVDVAPLELSPVPSALFFDSSSVSPDPVGDDLPRFRHDLMVPLSQMRDLVPAQVKKGYKVKRITGCSNKNLEYMNIVWYLPQEGESTPTGWYVYWSMMEAQLNSAGRDMASKGLYPAVVDGYGSPDGNWWRFVAVFEAPRPSGYSWWYDQSGSALNLKANDMFSKGYIVGSSSSYQTHRSQQPLHTSVFVTPSHSRPQSFWFGMAADNLRAKIKSQLESGLVATQVSVAENGMYSASFERADIDHYVVVEETDIDSQMASAAAKGYHPVSIDVYDEPGSGKQLWVAVFYRNDQSGAGGMLRFDTFSSVPAPVANERTFTETRCFDNLMTQFMRVAQVPGLGVAVMKRGKIVYKQGYGTRDVPNIDFASQGRPVLSSTPMRLASLSKAITALTVTKLVSAGKLQLDEPVFAKGAVLYGLTRGVTIADARVRNITVRQLLTHTGGWDRDIAFDPVSANTKVCQALGIEGPATPRDIIKFMLGQPLQHDPGTKYAYSNLGYEILGRVIEQVTGTAYEDAAWATYMSPARVQSHGMFQGRTQLADVRDYEPEYWDPRELWTRSVFPNVTEFVKIPYGFWWQRAHDSCGAWVATPSEYLQLIKFASPPHCNGTETDNSQQCVLTADELAMMEAHPPAYDDRSVWYGFGVLTDGKGYLSHTGLLQGVSTMFTKEHGDYAWAVMVNRQLTGSYAPMAQAVRNAINCVTTWPGE